MNICLLICLNVCFGCSLVGSLEYPQHIFCLRAKKNAFFYYTLFMEGDLYGMMTGSANFFRKLLQRPQTGNT